MRVWFYLKCLRCGNRWLMQAHNGNDDAFPLQCSVCRRVGENLVEA